MKWNEFYKIPHTIESFFEQLNIHSMFMERILDERPLKIIEIGIGRGTFTAFLSLLKIECTGIDIDASIVNKCKTFISSLDIKGNIKTGDAFNIPFDGFDLSISQGFFEHFSDKDIHVLLDEQLRVAKKVIFSVPSKYYRIKDFGNERLMTLEEWKQILSPYIVESMPYYYKRTKRNLLFCKPLMYCFVVESKKGDYR